MDGLCLTNVKRNLFLLLALKNFGRSELLLKDFNVTEDLAVIFCILQDVTIDEGEDTVFLSGDLFVLIFMFLSVFSGEMKVL